MLYLILETEMDFFVYDISNVESFQNISYSIYEIEKTIDKNVVIYLIGNKIDLEYKRIVYYENGKQIALKEKINFFGEVSAKTNENIMKYIIDFIKKFFIEIKRQY